MPHDPERVAEARSWCRKAAEDLRAGDFELTARPPLTADAVFHAQQAAEKVMKGFLTWHDRPFRKTHHLGELGEVCASIAPALETVLRTAVTLTEYAWKFRYPGELEEPSVTEARSALSLARDVHTAVVGQLPREVGA